MFQKALKSKNEPPTKAIGHDKKANKSKKFKENYENLPKGNIMKQKFPNPSNAKDSLALIEIHKSKIYRRNDFQREKLNNKVIKKPEFRSNQRKGLTRPFPKLKEVKSFPLLIPPNPSKSDFALQTVDSNRLSRGSEFKIQQQSKTSFKLPAEEDERLSRIYPTRLRDVEVKRTSKDSHTRLTQVSKTSFKLGEEEAYVPIHESRYYTGRSSSKTSFKLPTEEINQKTSNVIFNLPKEEPHKTHNSKLIQPPILRANVKRSSSTAGKQLTVHKGPKEIKPELGKKSSSILRTTSEGKLQSSVELDKRKHQISKTTSTLSLKSSRKSFKTEMSSQIQPRQTFFKSTSKLTVHKSFHDQRKPPSHQLRHRVAKSISSIGLRKISSKIKRKSKKGNLKESDKMSYPLVPKPSPCLQERESLEDDSNLPEELQLMRFVKRLKILLKVLKKLKESQEKRLTEEIRSSSSDSNVEPVNSPVNLEPNPLENQQATDDRESHHFNQTVEENIEAKPRKPIYLQKGPKTFTRYILKRSNPYSEDVVNPMAKRFKNLLAEVSSGSSSDGYTEWKSQIWKEYQETKRDDTLDHESCTTESSSSLDENLQNVAILKWPTSFEDVSLESISVPQSPKVEIVNFSIKKESPRALTQEELDNLGRFVDPLTGEILITPPTSTSSLATELSTTADEDKEEDDGDALFGQSMNLEDLYLDESLFQAWDEQYDKIQDEVMRTTLQSEERRALSLFIEQSRNLQLKKADEKPHILQLQKVPTIKEMLPQIVYEFLDSLVTKCVHKVETLDSREILRKSLCKRKLLRELQSMVCERDVERKFNNRLSVRVVDYLRRRDKLSLITEISPRIEKGCRERFYQTSEKLDKLLMRMEEARVFSQQKVKQESELCRKWMETSRAAIGDLEQFIRTSVVRDQHEEKLPLFIESQLRKMSKVRKEISETRYKLIQLQHMHCKLSLRSTNIQNIGNDLCINNFEFLYSEVQNLTKQNQEQEAKNERLRRHCSTYIEKVSHIREQNSMTRSVNQTRRFALDNLYAAIRWQRQKVCVMKSQHNEIRQIISDLKWRGGIMDKPLLMLDYDETVKRAQKLRGEIEKWKKQSNALEPQIKALEEKCFRVVHK